MKILFVTYGLPYPPDSGGRIHDFNILKNISKHHSVLLLSLLEFPDEVNNIPKLEKYCDLVDVVLMKHRSLWQHFKGVLRCLLVGQPIATHDYYYSDMADKIREVVAGSDIDIVQMENSFLAPYIKAVPDNSNCIKILSFHDLGSRQYRQMLFLKTGAIQKLLFLLKWILMLNWESKYARNFDHCTVVSPIENRVLKSSNPDLNVTTIPNGVETELLQPLPAALDCNTLLFVGTMGYPPNIDAVLYFCNEILPLIERRISNIKLLVVGNHPTSEIIKLGKRKNVLVTGYVSDVIPYYNKVCITIIPLRAGGGTRLKIIESMALGRPVVSTRVGAEGLNVVDQKNIIIADTPSKFSEGVIRLLQDKNLREEISRNARQVVESNYDWQTINQKLVALYSNLLAKR